MASSNMASSYTSGNMVVVTHMLPVGPGGAQQPSMRGRHKFRNGHPKALGTVQITIGAMTLLFGIATAIHQPSLGVYSGIFVWGALTYIAAGSVTVAAEKYLSRCLINASLVINIIAAVVSGAGVVLFGMDPAVFFGYPYHAYHTYYGGYSAVLAVFQFLELIVSIVVSAYACHATCCCTEPQVVVQAAEGPVTSQAPPHFQAASVAPPLPYPEVEPNFKNPLDLGSAEPPAYQPN